MKILKLNSITFSVLATLLISLSTIEISLAQLTTNNGNLFFQSTKQYLQGNNGINLKYRSNNTNSAAIKFYNNTETHLGSVYGSQNSNGNHIGFLDTDGHWSLVIKHDDYFAFKINNETKMFLNKLGQLDLSSTRDASGTPGTGVLEIANALRFDGNEIITNTDEPLHINTNNNGDVIFDGNTIRVDASANKVGIGIAHPAYKLHVNGDFKANKAIIGSVTSTPGSYKLFVEKGILTEKVRVAVKNSSQWADYVFEEDYDLMPINELQDYISENKHLPNVPSANEVVKDGIDMAQMDATLLEKIEEAYLYIIKQQQEIEGLKKAIKSIK